MIMNWRIASAILAGCVMGGALVFLLAPAGLWYLLGIPAGGAFAWLFYCWRDIVHAAPAAWASVSTWQPPRGLKQFGMYALSVFVLTSVVILWLESTVWLGLMREGSSPTILQIFCIVAFGVFYTSAKAFDNDLSGNLLRGNTKKIFRWALYLTPPGLVYVAWKSMRWLVPRIPGALATTAHFLLKLFVAVHSRDALDCFIYAAAGVALGALTTRTAWVVALSALLGIALAIAMRFIARKFAAPYLASHP